MKALAVAMATFAVGIAEACPTCRPQVEATVYDGAFWSHLRMLAIPFALVLSVAAVAYRSDGRCA